MIVTRHDSESNPGRFDGTDSEYSMYDSLRHSDCAHDGRGGGGRASGPGTAIPGTVRAGQQPRAGPSMPKAGWCRRVRWDRGVATAGGGRCLASDGSRAARLGGRGRSQAAAAAHSEEESEP